MPITTGPGSRGSCFEDGSQEETILILGNVVDKDAGAGRQRLRGQDFGRSHFRPVAVECRPLAVRATRMGNLPLTPAR